MKRHFCIVGLRIFKARRLRLFFLNSHEERLDDGPSFKKLAHFFMCFLSLKFGLCPDEGSYCIFIAVGKKKRESVVTHILYSSDVGGGVEKKVGIFATVPGHVMLFMPLPSLLLLFLLVSIFLLFCFPDL